MRSECSRIGVVLLWKITSTLGETSDSKTTKLRLFIQDEYVPVT